VIGTLVDQGD